jgi:IS5 family transposase
VPDATTLLKFRRLLEEKDLARTLFDTVKESLSARGLLLEKGTVVDATIVAPDENSPMIENRSCWASSF